MTRTRTAMVLFTVERLCSSAIQFCTVRSATSSVITVPRGGPERGPCASSGDHAHPPPGKVGVQRSQLQAAQSKVHVHYAVFGELLGGERRAQAGLCGLDDGLERFPRFFFAVFSLGQRLAALAGRIGAPDMCPIRSWAIRTAGTLVLSAIEPFGRDDTSAAQPFDRHEPVDVPDRVGPCPGGPEHPFERAVQGPPPDAVPVRNFHTIPLRTRRSSSRLRPRGETGNSTRTNSHSASDDS